MDLSIVSVVLHIFILVGFIFVIYLVTNRLDTAISITILGILVHFIFVYLSFFPI